MNMNRILYAADCLDVLNDENELPTESVDLIYLDPPFNSNSDYNLPVKSRGKGLAPVEAFADTWEWTSDDGRRLEEMESDPGARSLAAIVRFAQEVEGPRPPRQAQPRRLSYQYVTAPVGHAPRAETSGKHLSALRPDRQPLSQIGYGCCVWQKEFSQ